jgi:hypothetical protein
LESFLAIRFSDTEIVQLIQEPKPLPNNFESEYALKEKLGHKEGQLTVDGTAGNKFIIILRLNTHNAMDFSAILGVYPKNTTQIFRLRRYNGKSHEHTNYIEKETFYDFHIHYATSRYQQIGGAEDTYAERSNRFVNLSGAFECMISDCHIQLPKQRQLRLFKGIV